MNYLIEDKEIILTLHQLIMRNELIKGLANCANLDFAIYDYQRNIYPDIITKASALMFNIIRGQCFNDGNKRTALLSAATLLLFNGYELEELPLLYADFLVTIAKKAPYLKDNQVLGFINKMSKTLVKYVKKDSGIHKIVNLIAKEITKKEDFKKESLIKILDYISKKLSFKINSLNKAIERNKYKNL
jgi:death-on-curing protein